jgi:hypothetical protein
MTGIGGVVENIHLPPKSDKQIPPRASRGRRNDKTKKLGTKKATASERGALRNSLSPILFIHSDIINCA